MPYPSNHQYQTGLYTKQAFIHHAQVLLDANPNDSYDVVISEIEKITENFEEPVPLQEILSEQAYDFFISLKEDKKTSEEITEKGAIILEYMQKENEKNVTNFTAKSIGEGLEQNSRSISGGMRKLVSCGYVEKTGENPIVYKLTEKGKNLTI